MSKVFIEETSLSAIGDAIRAKTGSSDKMSPAQMVTAIGSITGGGGGTEIEPIVLSGSQSYGCSGALAAKMIELYPSKISTSGITNAQNMFRYYTGARVPFVINLSGDCDCSYIFSDTKITKAPVIQGSMAACQYMFQNCSYLVDISELANYTIKETGRGCSAFQSCKSLREVPAEVAKRISYTFSSKSYTSYAHTVRLVSDCPALENVYGVIPPVYTGTTALTANMFSYMVDNCHRLTHFTFATNDDGTPLVRDNYTAQTIDFSGCVGYVVNSYDTGLQYVGITNSTKVTDLTSYEALKDNPDWWTALSAFSRYNHDSAVETINSLPDVSSSGGTNTIKFKGTMGSGYGKAINTMTDAEIAVAAAKGWTVSIT